MRILIIDDDISQAGNLALLLQSWGHDASYQDDAEEGLHFFLAEEFDLLLLDMKMPKIDGLTVLRRAIETKPDSRVVMLTAYGTIETAVEAMKCGAFDFLVKPVEEARLRSVLSMTSDAAKFSEMARFSAPTGPEDESMIALDPAMRKVKDLVRRVASLSTTILIHGETGTGKELVARAIHFNSPRKDKAFVAVNCANLQGNLLESELFGHEKGAFTGANARKLGRFEIASGGTLFLDEVGEMPLELQAKLLRVLQEQEFERVGGLKPIRVDVRIVSATNRSLLEMVEASRFRQDLYYRLNVFSLRLPPLRERSNDIKALSEHFLEELSAKHGGRKFLLSAEALDWLKTQSWPGNIRELQNLLERAVIVNDDGTITGSNLAAVSEVSWAEPAVAEDSLNGKLSESEKGIIEAALTRFAGNVIAASRSLGLPRRTMYDRLKKLGIDPSKFRRRP